MKRMALSAAALLLSSTALAGGEGANIRVIHLSPDAPAIDVIVNDDNEFRAFENVAFPEGTNYTNVPAGSYDFDVVPTGENADATVLPIDDVELSDSDIVSVAAIDFLDNITALPIGDKTGAEPGTIDYRFVHAASGVGAVEAFLANSAGVFESLNTTLEFQEFTGYLNSAGTSINAALDANLDGIVDLSFPAELPAGTSTNIYVVNDGTAVFAIAHLENGDTARVDAQQVSNYRGIHLAPNVGPVDVFLNGENAGINGLDLRSSTGWIPVIPGNYTIGLAPAGGSSDQIVSDITTNGVPETSTLVFFSEGAQQTLAIEENFSPVAEGETRLNIAHTAAAVGEVDLWDFSDPENPAPLITDLSFGSVENFEGVFAVSTLAVDANNDQIPEFTASLPSLEGAIANIFVLNDGETKGLSLGNLSLIVQFGDNSTAEIPLDPVTTLACEETATLPGVGSQFFAFDNEVAREVTLIVDSPIINPVPGITEDQESIVVVTDSDGNLVREASVTGSNQPVELQNIDAGNYLISVSYGSIDPVQTEGSIEVTCSFGLTPSPTPTGTPTTPSPTVTPTPTAVPTTSPSPTITPTPTPSPTAAPTTTPTPTATPTPSPTPAGTTNLRVLHLSPDAPNVDVIVNGDNDFRAVENLPFQIGTGYLEIPAGTYDFDVVASGADVDQSVLPIRDLTLEADEFYTAVAFDELASISALPLLDDQSPTAEGEIRLRAIHTATGVGQVDVLLLNDLEAPPAILEENLDFGAAGAFLNVPAGAYRIGLDLDNDLVAELVFSLPELPAGAVANVYAVNGDPAGLEPFALVQLADGTTIRFDPTDTDRDGLTDGAEIIALTNLVLRDTDGDGIEDGVEAAIGTDPLDPNDPEAFEDADGDGVPASDDPDDTLIDTDGDGVNDRAEISLGFDANDAASTPSLGDVNGDGVADHQDAILILNLFLDNIGPGLFPGQETYDLNRDRIIDFVDGVILFNFFLGNLDSIPLN